MKYTTTATLLALAADFAAAVTPNPGSVWQNTLFLDEFNGPAGSGPSTSNWIYDYGTQYNSPNAPPGWGNNEVQYYTSQRKNLKLNGNGALQITPQVSNGNWTSGRLETVLDSFQPPTNGSMRIEARIKLPAVTSSNGLGYWPAFWATGAAYRGNYTNWPSIGEYDIMENISGESYITQGLHCDVNPGGVCNEPDGLGTSASCTGTACLGNYHVYTLIVNTTATPQYLQYQLDGVATKTITQTQLGNSIWRETVDHGYFLIVNVAMGGNYPNAVAGETTPTSATVGNIPMLIDYVAVWTT